MSGSNIGAERLRSLVERIERLEEEKRGIAADIKDIYAEAKSAGYDVKALRALIAERRRDAQEEEEKRALIEVYRDALAGLVDTPLGQAALELVS